MRGGSHRSERVTVDDAIGAAVEGEVTAQGEVHDSEELTPAFGDVVPLHEGTLRNARVFLLRLVFLMVSRWLLVMRGRGDRGYGARVGVAAASRVATEEVWPPIIIISP